MSLLCILLVQLDSSKGENQGHAQGSKGLCSAALLHERHICERPHFIMSPFLGGRQESRLQSDHAAPNWGMFWESHVCQIYLPTEACQHQSNMQSTYVEAVKSKASNS